MDIINNLIFIFSEKPNKAPKFIATQAMVYFSFQNFMYIFLGNLARSQVLLSSTEYVLFPDNWGYSDLGSI